jgi:hypothetical protein
MIIPRSGSQYAPAAALPEQRLQQRTHYATGSVNFCVRDLVVRVETPNSQADLRLRRETGHCMRESINEK